MPTNLMQNPTFLVSSLITFLLAFALGIYACLLLRPSPNPQSPQPTNTSTPTTTPPTTDLPPQPNAPIAAAAQQIKSILDETENTIAHLRPGLDKLTRTLAAITHATKQLRNIDTSNCPTDFQLACLAYCQARESYIASLPKGDLNSLVNLGLHFLHGEKDAGLSKISDTTDARIAHIRDCSNDLELTALRHGIRL